jgi:hypothetical protein
MIIFFTTVAYPVRRLQTTTNLVAQSVHAPMPWVISERQNCPDPSASSLWRTFSLGPGDTLATYFINWK